MWSWMDADAIRRLPLFKEDKIPMSPEEKTVIGGIFERLKGASTAQRDAEAEKFIAEQIKAQPYAPYVMAQSIYAQEQALNGMQQQVQQLQAQVQQLEQYAQQVQQQQQQSSGFLGGLFGGGSKVPPPPMPMNNGMNNGVNNGMNNGMGGRPQFQQGQMGGPAPGPWGQQQPMQQGGMQQPGPWGQQAQPQQRGGMGFLGHDSRRCRRWYAGSQRDQQHDLGWWPFSRSGCRCNRRTGLGWSGVFARSRSASSL
jgi:hypothetical protein